MANKMITSLAAVAAPRHQGTKVEASDNQVTTTARLSWRFRPSGWTATSASWHGTATQDDRVRKGTAAR